MSTENWKNSKNFKCRFRSMGEGGRTMLPVDPFDHERQSWTVVGRCPSCWNKPDKICITKTKRVETTSTTTVPLAINDWVDGRMRQLVLNGKRVWYRCSSEFVVPVVIPTCNSSLKATRTYMYMYVVRSKIEHASFKLFIQVQTNHTYRVHTSHHTYMLYPGTVQL